MVNDTSTVAGALQECIDHLEDNLAAKGVTASYAPSTGMIGLIDEILNIQTGGSCYHIEFSEASYVAVGGSATLEVYLQSNYQPLSGATVTVTGSDSSLYTGITNSSGIAQVTVTNVTGTATFTATYQNVNDTCTVNGISYLFYDACDSSAGLSNYGSSHWLKVNTASITLSYDSTKNAYKMLSSGTDGFADIPIPSLDGKNNYYIEAEFYTTDTTTGGQPGLAIYSAADTTGNGVMFRDIAQINRCGVLKFLNGSENGESGNSQQSSLPVANNWIKVRLEIQGTSVTGKWLTIEDDLVYSYSYTIPSYTNPRVGLATLPKYVAYPYYVRNIKAASL